MEIPLEPGFAGLFLISFLAATVLPVVAEPFITAMLLAGYDPVTCVIVATAGNFLGGMSTFGLGYLGELAWLEKWFNMSHEKSLKFTSTIKRYGAVLAFFSWVPFIGDPLTVALGLGKAKVTTVMIFMLAGKGLRYLLWMLLSQAGISAFG